MISEVIGQPITLEKLRLLDGHQPYQDDNQIKTGFERTSEFVDDETPGEYNIWHQMLCCQITRWARVCFHGQLNC